MTLAAALRYLGENVAAIRIDFIVLSHRLCLSRPTGAIWSAPEGDAVCAALALRFAQPIGAYAHLQRPIPWTQSMGEHDKIDPNCSNILSKIT